MNLLQICKLLRRLWKEGAKKEAWFVYVTVLQRSHHGRKWWKFDAWQHYDVIGSFYNGGGAFRRARGASKTRDLSAVAVFLRIVVGPVVWFAAIRKQLMKAQEYWTYNPFVEQFSITINRQFIKTVEFDVIEISVLSQGNARGPRGCVIIFDEMALMDREVIDATRGITNGMGDDIYIYVGSTPVINTAFQDYCDASNWERVHPFYHCSWMNIEKILQDKKEMMDAAWRQENLAHFTVMDGMIFERNIHRGTYLGRLQPEKYYGVDPNPREGYIVTGGQFDYDQNVYQFNYVKDFGTGAAGKNAMIAFLLEQGRLTQTYGIEFETNGVGKVIADDMDELGVRYNGVDWNEKNKIRRVNDILKVQIYIPKGKEYDKLYNQFAALQWDETGKKVKKVKGNPYHYVDSGLHAIQYSGGAWVYV